MAAYVGPQGGFGHVTPNNGSGIEILDTVGSNYGEMLNPGGTLPPDYTLGQSEYDFTQRVFPSDLGSDNSYHGHYMVININVQTASKMEVVSKGGVGGAGGSIAGTSSARNFTVMEGELSKTDTLRYRIDSLYKNFEGRSLNQELGSRPRFTRRIKESIAIYMPNSEMTFSDAHDFENISLTKFVGAVAGGALGVAGGAIGGLVGGITGGPLGAMSGINIAGNVTNGVNGAASAIAGAAQIGGTPINPKVELLYANTFQREFAFDFLFSPSNAAEAATLEQIIRTLRFHAAPEYFPGILEQFFWIPPSEFDITFYNRGQENTRIPRISTCALKQIDVSYAPAGVYSTFRDGAAVQTRMVLRFVETEVVSKLRVLQGF